MSVISKKLLLEDITKALQSAPLTIDSVRETVARCLECYDVEQVAQEAQTFDYLAAYLQAKSIEGRSKGTLTRYEYIIKRLLAHAKVPESSITIYHIRAYFAAQKARGISDHTLEGERSVFSAYFGWLWKEKLIQSDPCANLGAIKHVKKVRKPFTDVEIEKLKECCTCIRDKALIAFLLSTGCRINEVCTLDRSAVSLISKECTVLGKGNKERKVYINDVAAMLLHRYLSERTDDDPALFYGRGGRIHPGGVRAMLKKLEAISGVDNVHPHRFRRTLATNLIHRGMAIQEVAHILGHDKIDTTMEYVYIEDSNVQSAYRRCS